MSPKFRSLIPALTIAAAAAFVLMPGSSIAGTAAEIDSSVDKALASLYGQMPQAKKLGETSKGVLVFPRIIKGGLIFIGGQYGDVECEIRRCAIIEAQRVDTHARDIARDE